MNGSESSDASMGDLPIEEWTPVKANDLELSNSGSSCYDNPIKVKNERLAYEDIVTKLEEEIQSLLKTHDFTISDVRPGLKFVQRQTRYNPDVFLNKQIIAKIVRLGIAHVFLRAWQSVNACDYLHPSKMAIFRNWRTALSIIWNCSDKSAPLCDSLVRCGVVQLFMEELSSAKLQESDLKNANILYLVKAYLGILHNMVRLCSDSQRVLRSSNAVSILQRYINREHGLVKTKAYIILSYIISEDENEILTANEENLQFIILILKEALDSENHFSKRHAFWVAEITDGLNHLAANDSNKVKLGKLGVFPLYLKLLESGNTEEQNLGAAGLWILAFQEDNKALLKHEPGCMETLQSLATTSPHENIRRAARGALWVVKTAPDRPPKPKVDDSDIPHIMISYHWNAQPIMLEVKTRLRAAGYKVWMDVDNMSGSTLEAMALAVERAAVILICMSDGYKDSPSCRTEAEYTYRRHKDIIPLLLQTGYMPDGWLGMLVGARLFFDFSAKDRIDSQMPRLLKELGNRGKLAEFSREDSTSAPSTSGSHISSVEGAPRPLPTSLSTCSLHSYAQQPDTGSWCETDVKSWLERNSLEELSDRLDSFDGEMLLQYKHMLETCPNFFYHSLETMLGMNITTILKFSRALSELQ